MVVKDNSLEIAVAKARRDEAALGEIEKQKALAKQRTADSQELRVMKAGMAARRLSMKVLRLGALRHWLLIGMMRAFRRWALALDVGDAYAAALGSIAAAFSGGATALEASLDDAQTRAVGSLLARPAMLGPLAELRRRLQIGMTEAEMLRQKLDELTTDGAEAAARVSPWLPQRQASELLERLAATAAAGSSPERRRPAAAAARAFVAAAAAGARSPPPPLRFTAAPRADAEAAATGATLGGEEPPTRPPFKEPPTSPPGLAPTPWASTPARRMGPGARLSADDAPDPLSSGDSAGAQLKMRVLVASWRQLRHALAAKAAALRQTEKAADARIAEMGRAHAERSHALLSSCTTRRRARPPSASRRRATRRSCSAPASTRRGTTRRSAPPPPPPPASAASTPRRLRCSRPRSQWSTTRTTSCARASASSPATSPCCRRSTGASSASAGQRRCRALPAGAGAGGGVAARLQAGGRRQRQRRQEGQREEAGLGVFKFSVPHVSRAVR